jgi:hypothetical protein
LINPGQFFNHKHGSDKFFLIKRSEHIKGFIRAPKSFPVNLIPEMRWGAIAWFGKSPAAIFPETWFIIQNKLNTKALHVQCTSDI